MCGGEGLSGKTRSVWSHIFKDRCDNLVRSNWTNKHQHGGMLLNVYPHLVCTKLDDMDQTNDLLLCCSNTQRTFFRCYTLV